MIISKIRMENFRGFKDKTIQFYNKQLVLLFAANGIGKTTTIDAIEWCLTGEIGRLRHAYDARCPNQSERLKNNDGILKNRYSSRSEKVKVTLWLQDSDGEIIVCREQLSDEIDKSMSNVSVFKNDKEIKKFLDEYIDKNFYNFHFCDVQKSFEIQNKKRRDLKGFFEDFITNYDSEKQVAKNLKNYVADIDSYIKDKNDELKKINSEIEIQNERINNQKEITSEIDYPQIPFYLGEKLNVLQLDENELIAQKNKLKKCGYNYVNDIVSQLIDDDYLAEKESILNKIIHLFKTKGICIKEAVELGLFSNNSKLTEIEKEIYTLQDLKINKSTYKDIISFFSSANFANFNEEDFKIKLFDIDSKEKLITELEKEIDNISHNNEMIKLLSFLVVRKNNFVEYRNNAVQSGKIAKCPICGSEHFSSIGENDILKESELFIEENGRLAKKKEEELKKINEEKEHIISDVILDANNLIQRRIDELKKDKIKIDEIKKESDNFYVLFKQLQNNEHDLTIDTFNLEKAQNILATIKEKRMLCDEKNAMIESYQQVLNSFCYFRGSETLLQVFEKTNILMLNKEEFIDFSFDSYVLKNNTIDILLTHKKILEATAKLKELKSLKQKINNKIDELTDLKKVASEKAKKIERLVVQLSKEEYENVGPSLEKFYNKLIRFNINNGIKIVPDKEGISLLDETNKNIVNIMSNGQISVFMLAYFFAGINARYNQDKLKIFFIDDLTACMDDVNMLAFLDIIKYSMSRLNDKSIDQLFFVTCDERISNLLEYKMNGRNIGITKLEEKDIIESQLYQ